MLNDNEHKFLEVVGPVKYSVTFYDESENFGTKKNVNHTLDGLLYDPFEVGMLVHLRYSDNHQAQKYFLTSKVNHFSVLENTMTVEYRVIKRP